MTPRFFLLFALCVSLGAAAPAFVAAQAQDDTPWVVYEGAEGPGQGKHIVLVSGDEEYRSEEALTQLARILAFRHGFKTTTLYAIHPESGVIDPGIRAYYSWITHARGSGSDDSLYALS